MMHSLGWDIGLGWDQTTFMMKPRQQSKGLVSSEAARRLLAYKRFWRDSEYRNQRNNLLLLEELT